MHSPQAAVNFSEHFLIQARFTLEANKTKPNKKKPSVDEVFVNSQQVKLIFAAALVAFISTSSLSEFGCFP